MKRSKTYEGSKADMAEDRKGAKKLGMSAKAYEKSARDIAEDARGQKKLQGRKR